MERITSRTAAEDVRKAAGYDRHDWTVFQVGQSKDMRRV